MTLIIIGVLAAIINGLLVLADEMLGSLFNVAFHMDWFLGETFNTIFSALSSTFYNIGTALIVLKFMKKAFDIYVLWSDGDKDVEPSNLLINFIKAIVTAIAFPYVYNIFIDLAEETLTMAIDNIGGGQSLGDMWAETSWQSFGIVPTIFGFVFVICIVILFISALKQGIELMLLQIGVPLACVGLLDNDKGYFKSYCTLLIKSILTVLFQILLCRLGITFALSSGMLNNSSGFMNLYFGIAAMLLAISAPKILGEFLIPTGSGGGISQKIYSTTMVASTAKRLFMK